MKVSTHEAKTHLSRLLDDAEAGKDVVICRNDRPIARLVRVGATRNRRPTIGKPTSGPVRCAPDAFAPLSHAELGEWGL